MFKKPIEVDLNVPNVAITHRIALSQFDIDKIRRTVTETAVAIGVIVVAVAASKSTINVIEHAARNKIK